MLDHTHFDRLKQTVFFGALPEPVFDAIAAHAHTLDIRQGEVIVQQGQPSEAVFCVVAGAIKLTAVGPTGREVVVDIFEPGTSFAEALLFRSDVYPVSAIALKPSTVVALPKSVIEQELRSNPENIALVLSATYAHLHSLIRQVEHLKASSGLQRVAGFLLTLAERHDEQAEFKMPYEKQTIASMLGIKPETLSRSFRRLSEHGVRINGPSVHIHDRAALQTFLDDA